MHSLVFVESVVTERVQRSSLDFRNLPQGFRCREGITDKLYRHYELFSFTVINRRRKPVARSKSIKYGSCFGGIGTEMLYIIYLSDVAFYSTNKQSNPEHFEDQRRRFPLFGFV